MNVVCSISKEMKDIHEHSRLATFLMFKDIFSVCAFGRENKCMYFMKFVFCELERCSSNNRRVGVVGICIEERIQLVIQN